MHLLEEFVVVNASMPTVERVMRERDLMQQWMSPAVQFQPLDGWEFTQGDRWSLTLTGLGSLLKADYVVHERRDGLILWAFNGFWEGFDAWHWYPNPTDKRQTVIQNRIEYELRIPGLELIWRMAIGPAMGWDAKVQMERLKKVCESVVVSNEPLAVGA
ncbi:MAG: SRPBCC family protein [Chloroflexaceae bacterium]|jgi:hypothetical protein|nr:SRPBCC family protein [Chloroflexaceae bacterium]